MRIKSVTSVRLHPCHLCGCTVSVVVPFPKNPTVSNAENADKDAEGIGIPHGTERLCKRNGLHYIYKNLKADELWGPLESGLDDLHFCVSCTGLLSNIHELLLDREAIKLKLKIKVAEAKDKILEVTEQTANKASFGPESRSEHREQLRDFAVKVDLPTGPTLKLERVELADSDEPEGSPLFEDYEIKAELCDDSETNTEDEADLSTNEMFLDPCEVEDDPLGNDNSSPSADIFSGAENDNQSEISVPSEENSVVAISETNIKSSQKSGHKSKCKEKETVLEDDGFIQYVHLKSRSDKHRKDPSSSLILTPTTPACPKIKTVPAAESSSTDAGGQVVMNPTMSTGPKIKLVRAGLKTNVVSQSNILLRSNLQLGRKSFKVVVHENPSEWTSGSQEVENTTPLTFSDVNTVRNLGGSEIPNPLSLSEHALKLPQLPFPLRLITISDPQGKVPPSIVAVPAKPCLPPQLFSDPNNSTKIPISTKTYLCDYCDTVFANKSLVVGHYQTFHPEQPRFRCSDCTREFLLSQDLVIHLRRDHMKKSALATKIIKETLDGRTDEQKEKAKIKTFDIVPPAPPPPTPIPIVQELRFKCRLCPENPPSFKALVEHFKEKHEGQLPFNCPKKGCSKTALHRGEITRHIAREHTKKPPEVFDPNKKKTVKITNICRICGVKRKNRKALIKHFEKKHKWRAPFMCPEEGCGETYWCPYELRRHFRRYHSENAKPQPIVVPKVKIKKKRKRYVPRKDMVFCPVCREEFLTIGLTFHLLSHETEEKKFSCTKCNKRFTLEANLITHGEYHKYSEDLPFGCDSCETRYRLQSQLNKHLLMWHPEALFECRICKKNFPEEILARAHETYHLEGKMMYSCHLCPYQSDRKTRIRTHAAAMHEQRTVRCTEKDCDKLFGDKDALAYHIKFIHLKHPKQKYSWRKYTGSFVCEICGCNLKTSAGLKDHINCVHYGMTRCPKCRRLVSKSNMEMHLDTAHGLSGIKQLPNRNRPGPVVQMSGSGPQAMCPICSLRFRDSKAVKKHRKRNTCHLRLATIHQDSSASQQVQPPPEETFILPFDLDPSDTKHVPFNTVKRPVKPMASKISGKYMRRANNRVVCPVCQEDFSNSYALKMHSMRHSNERPFPCPQCKFAFRTDVSRNEHIRRVHDESPGTHECTNCGLKTYKVYKDLLQHRKLCLGVYRCRVCEKNFWSQTKLDKHLRIHNTEEGDEASTAMKTKPSFPTMS